MAEFSLPFGGTVIGDCGPYNDDVWSDTWRKLFIRDRTQEGVLVDYANQLAVTGVASPIQVDTGAAMVDGKFYENDLALAVAVPAPVIGDRIDQIVLRKSWAAQTVRVTRIAGVDGGAMNPIVQVDGVTWDVVLAWITTTVLGVITVTDRRDYVGSPLAALFAPAGTDRTIAAGVITVDGKTFFRVDTEGAAASDDLDTINGGYTGQVIVVRIVNAARIVSLTTAGNLAIGAPITLSLTSALIFLRYTGAAWEAVGGMGGADILVVQVFS